MTARYHDSVSFLVELFKGNVEQGQIVLPPMAPDEIILELRMKIKGEDGAYYLSDAQAKELHYLSSIKAGAYDLAARVCATNLMMEKPIPEPLRLFAALALTRKIERPKGAKRDKSWMANTYKYAMIRFAVMNFGLLPTRGDNNAALSACDAVADAITACGHHVDYFSLKRLVVEKRYSLLREEAGTWAALLMELGKAEAKIYPRPAAFQSLVADEVSNSDTPEPD